MDEGIIALWHLSKKRTSSVVGDLSDKHMKYSTISKISFFICDIRNMLLVKYHFERASAPLPHKLVVTSNSSIYVTVVIYLFIYLPYFCNIKKSCNKILYCIVLYCKSMTLARHLFLDTATHERQMTWICTPWMMFSFNLVVLSVFKHIKNRIIHWLRKY